MKKFFLIFATFFTFLQLGYAMRPCFTDDYGVLDNEKLEYELGIEFLSNEFSGYMSVGTGISNINTLYFVVPYQFLPERVAGDIEIVSKIKILSYEGLPYFTVKFDMIPVIGEYTITGISSLIYEKLNFHINFGYKFPEEEVPVGIAVEYRIVQFLQIIADVFLDDMKNKDTEIKILTGIRLWPTDNFAIDIGAYYGVKDEKVRYTIGFVFDTL
jgi:hypothetical protein